MTSEERNKLIQSYREAAAALASSVRSRGLSPQNASKLASKVASLADKQLPVITASGLPLDCKPACCDCCYQMVFATAPEIAQYMEMVTSWPKDKRDALLDKLRNYKEQVQAGKNEFYLRTRAACPFLENSLCTIYEQRPIVCRGLSSTDVEICRHYHANPSAENDFGPNNETEFVLGLAQGVNEGLYGGKSNSLLPMPLILLDLLEHDGLVDDFLANPKSNDEIKRDWHIRFTPPAEDPIGLPPVNEAYEEFLSQWRSAPGEKLMRLFDEPSTANAIARVFTPVLYKDESEVVEWRTHFEAAVNVLQNFEPWDPVAAYHALYTLKPIGAAYQAISMRPLMATLGSVLHERVAKQLAPELLEPMPVRRPGKIRVGIAGQILDSSGTNWTLGWVKNFDRSRFEVAAIKLAGPEDAMSFAFKDTADHYYRLAGHPLEIARFIRSLDLDYLLFPDIGDVGVLYQMAIFRLAGRQAAGWGCPHTTGLRMIDDYLSSELMEPEGAESEYTEQLVRLPNLGFTLEPPPRVRVRRERSDFGLPEGFLVSFPQFVMKWLPQWDEVLARIAAKAGNPIVLIESGFAYERAIFDERMKKLNVPVIWLPKSRPMIFRRIVQLCDVALDSPDWSGGLTSMYSLFMGTPFVNLPGQYFRTRLAKGFCEMAGAPGLVAENVDDYIDLATNRDRLNAAMQTLDADRLFGDLKPLRALEDWISSTVNA